MSNIVKKYGQVDYTSLDDAKKSFIKASKRTLNFAKKYGFVPNERLGSSSNIFSLSIKPFLRNKKSSIQISLLPEGLGTADDARPDDLSSKELEKFWHNIAYKTLAAITNDVASAGIQPILISLYLPSSSPEVVFSKEFRAGFLNGFVAGCKKIGCVYFSGETPQLRSKIFRGKLDIAGAVFGLVPNGVQPIDGTDIKPGDKIIFIESSGPHENGFSPIRNLASKLPKGYRTKLRGGKEYWEAANAPSILYSPFIQDLLSNGLKPSNIEPLTGHGWQKLMRVSKPFRYIIEKTLPVPEIFKFFQEQIGSTSEDMLKIFNYGAGLAIFIEGRDNANEIVIIAKKHKLNALVAGHIEESKKREVVVEPLDVTLTDEEFSLKK